MNKFLKIINQENEEPLETHEAIQRKKGGRPRKTEMDKKTERIFLNVTKEQKEILQMKAQSAGLSINAFLTEHLKTSNVF